MQYVVSCYSQSIRGPIIPWIYLKKKLEAFFIYSLLVCVAQICKITCQKIYVKCKNEKSWNNFMNEWKNIWYCSTLKRGQGQFNHGNSTVTVCSWIWHQKLPVNITKTYLSESESVIASPYWKVLNYKSIGILDAESETVKEIAWMKEE